MITLDSILASTKQKLGLTDNYDVFDDVIISHINSAFFVLWQLGAGRDKSKPFTISDDKAQWSDFIDDGLIEVVRDFVYIKVKLIFDPPTNSFLVDQLEKQMRENEWRITVAGDEYDPPFKDG